MSVTSGKRYKDANAFKACTLGMILCFSDLLSVARAQGQVQQGGGDPFLSEEQQLQQIQQTISGQCSPCDGPVDESLGFDDTSCVDWLQYASQLPANSEECTLERLLGWRFCGCPAPAGVTDKCTFCNDAGSIEKDKTLPFSSITCNAFLNVPALDGNNTCKLAGSFAAYCGCTTATPQCTLCGDGAPPQNMDAPLYMGMTCADVHDLYLVSSALRCGDLAADYPFDLQSYCGCNNAPKTDNGCDFCPYQGTLNNHTQPLINDPTTTCGDWAALAEYAKEGGSSCAVFQYVGLECCDSMQTPEFFDDYMDEQGAAEQPGEEAPSLEPAVDQGKQVEPADGSSTHDPALIIPETTQTVVDINTATSINEAIHMCFQEYTTPLVAITSVELSLPPSTTTASPSGQLAEQTKPEDVFLQQARSTSGGSTANPTSGSVESSHVNNTVKDGFDLAQAKWKQLFQDLNHVSLPNDFVSMIPQEISSNTFLPGLSECLVSAASRFTTCNLCADGQKVSKPERMINVIGLYCDEYEAWRADSTAEDCQSYDRTWLPFNMASYCGCPGVPDVAAVAYGEEGAAVAEIKESTTEKCTFCPQGMVLVLEPWKQSIQNKSLLHSGGYVTGSTCAEWSQMADYASTSQGCTFLQTLANADCCEVIGESILDPATFPAANVTSSQPGATEPASVNETTSSNGTTTSGSSRSLTRLWATTLVISLPGLLGLFDIVWGIYW
jgi:hypothetical protein